VYIRWVGNNIPRMQKAKIGTHAGDIYKLFAPCHTRLDTPDRNEITDENIMKQIGIASGSYQHVVEGRPIPKQQSQPRTQATTVHTTQPRAEKVPVGPKADTHGGVAKTVENVVDFVDLDGIKMAIQEVRNDSSSTNWVLITYDGPRSNTLKMEGTGSGGLAEIKSLLKDNVIMYGLYRLNERIDDSVTVKFCYIDWRGERIHTMQRAKLATHSGAIRALFHPFHVDVQASQDDELTDTIVQKKISAAAGTAHFVVDR